MPDSDDRVRVLKVQLEYHSLLEASRDLAASIKGSLTMTESIWVSDYRPNEHIYWQFPIQDNKARPLLVRIPTPGYLFDLCKSGNMTSAAQQPLLCWTVCSYRRPGMSEEDYHNYTSQVHGPLVKSLLAKYNIVSYTQIHNTAEKKALMAKLFDPQFACIADYDCIITATFRDIEDFVRLKADPEYQRVVAPDHENFADTKRSRHSIGWVEHHLYGGVPVESN